MTLVLTRQGEKTPCFYSDECELESKSSKYINIHRRGHHDCQKWLEANRSQSDSIVNAITPWYKIFTLIYVN